MADSNIEKYLKKLRGDDTDLPYTPESNVESYLAKMAGQDVELPAEPESRVEALLADMVGNGGYSGSAPGEGNPNYVETITGDIDSLFGKYSIEEVGQSVNSKNWSITGIVKNVTGISSNMNCFVSCPFPDEIDITAAVFLTNKKAGFALEFSVEEGFAGNWTRILFSDGTYQCDVENDLSLFANATFDWTIIHHPMPSGN